MSYQAGSAFVSIKPDMTGFQDAITAEFAKSGDAAGKAFADAFQAQVKASFANLPDAVVKADADTTTATAEFDTLAADRTAVITPEADTAAADAELDAAATTRTAVIDPKAGDTAVVGAELDELARTRSAEIDVNGDTAQATLDSILAKINSIVKPSPKKVSIQATLSEAGSNLGELGKNLLSPAVLTAGLALGPSAVGATLGIAGIGTAFAAAGADAAGFGVIAKGMFTDVTTAQKALTTAQGQYAKATTSADQAKALKAEADAVKNLTPAEKDLLTQLTGLESAWKNLSQAEQPVVESALTPWLQTATSSMQLLSPLIEDGAGAIGLLGQEADKALQSPFWSEFAGTLGATGQAALIDFGEAAGSIGDGLAHLFVTFAPDIDNLLSDIPTLAGDFDTWAKNVKAGGLEDFFAKTFSHANLSTLKGDLDNVGQFFGTVAQATQTMSPLAFNGLSVLLEAIGSLPPDAVLALTALFLATKTISAIGNIAGLAGNVISLGKSAAGALGLGATAAEEAAEGTAAGAEAGTAAATSFTTTFITEINAALPTAFLTVGTTGATAAEAAGTAMGTAGATAFVTAFSTESATGLTAAFTAEDIAGTVEATAAGAELGTALAAGFTGALGAIATGVAAAVPEAGLVAVLAAGVAGAALGTAFGLSFSLALSASGASSAVSGLVNDAKSAVSGASAWLVPAGAATVQGYVAGFVGQQAGVVALGAQLKGWVQTPTAAANTWLTPAGTQTGSSFSAGIASTHAEVNSTAASMKNWVTDNFQPAGAWLTNAGISVVQGLANGILSEANVAISAAQSLANSITSTVQGALQVNSPAKVMIPLGSAVPEGLAVGMTGGAHFVTAAGTALADVTAQSLAGIAVGQSAVALQALGVPSIAAPARLPGVSSPLRSGGLQLQVSYAGTGNQVTDAIVSGLQFHVQATTGGDVQAALGRGPVRV